VGRPLSRRLRPWLVSGLLPAARLRRSLPGSRGLRRRFVPGIRWQLLPKALSAPSLSPCAYAFRSRPKSTVFEQAPTKDWRFAQYIVRGLLPISSDFELFSGIDTEKPLVSNPAVAIIDNDFRRLVGFRQPNRFRGAFPKLLPVEVCPAAVRRIRDRACLPNDGFRLDHESRSSP
jgi:hypothetical protein